MTTSSKYRMLLEFNYLVRVAWKPTLIVALLLYGISRCVS